MRLKDEFSAARLRWAPMTLYEKFEHASILILSGLIAIVIVASIWSLAIKILVDVVLTSGVDPSNYATFQDLHGDHRARVQALAARRGGTARQHRAGARGGADRAARGHAQADHPRFRDDRRAEAVRARRGHAGARRGLLAAARAGPAAGGEGGIARSAAPGRR
jgi:hypothetical protein